MHLHLLFLALGVLTGMAAIGLLMVIREGRPERGPSCATRRYARTRPSVCEAGTRVR
jgi:formate-dependent nitrite reductase membrane component NrfD